MVEKRLVTGSLLWAISRSPISDRGSAGFGITQGVHSSKVRRFLLGSTAVANVPRAPA